MTEQKLKGDALINEVVKKYQKNETLDFKPGDTVKVNVRIVEGNKTRIQAFEGLVIKLGGSGISKTFTVRKISYGIGVERTFPFHAPTIESVQVLRRGKVRRAKLNYIRNLSTKNARIKEKRTEIKK